jgi:signal transduction histidine kinase/ligand-binding sensor domain-containing protein/DNA-binding response OmpR family regulator
MQIKKSQVVQFVYLLWISISVSANTITVQNVNDEHKIPRKKVNCMFQDTKGFVWFGLINGLSKFDQYSYTFLNSRKNKVNPFPQADVKAILEIRPGLLLIGTSDKGLLIYDSEIERTYEVYCESVDLSKLNIRCLYIENFDIVWIGTSKGLYRVQILEQRADKFVVQLIKDIGFNKLYNDEFVYIKESTTGMIWFATMLDIGCYNPATGGINSMPLFYSAIKSFTFLDKKRILIGFYEIGLKIFDMETFKLEDFRIKGIPEKSLVRYVYKDKDENVWVSISNLGLVLFNPKESGAPYTPEKIIGYPKLNSNLIYQVNESRDGALWVCTEDGLNVITMKKAHFSSYQSEVTVQNIKHTAGVRYVLDSKKGFLWVGTLGGGLKQFDLSANKFTDVPLFVNGKEIGSRIQTILQDSRGYLWLGTEGEGIIRFRPDKNKGYLKGEIVNYRLYPIAFPSQTNTVLNDYIMCLLEDRRGNIWIGTWNGLSLIELSDAEKNDQSQITIKNFVNNASDNTTISNNTIMSLLQDNEGNVWAATQKGINKIQRTSKGYQFLHSFKNNSGDKLTEKIVLSMFQSKNGKFWFSSQQGGIFNLDTKTGIYEELNTNNAFFDNTINSIEEDRNGNLWIGSNNGLCLLNPISCSFNVYTTDDGLISNDFLLGSRCKIGDTLCFGSLSGLTFFSPLEITPAAFKPNLVFTDLRLFNKPININEEGSPLKRHISSEEKIHLKYNQNFITICFAALDYKHHNEIQYSCILEGLETSWNFLNNENKATYTSLAPGKYVFKVKAFSSVDYKNISEISIKIIVSPPFWNSVWAYILYLLIITISLIQTYRYIINKEKQKNALFVERLRAKKTHEADLMRLQFFTNISHEFRTPLTLLSAPLESLIKEDPDKAKAHSYYQLMQKNVQRLTRLIDQLLDFRKIEEGYLKMEWNHGDIIDFIRKTSETFQNYAQKRNIDFAFESGVPELFTYFDTDKLDKILFNLISNAFKYTENFGKISVCIDKKEGRDLPFTGLDHKYLEIKISDTGIGIPQEAIGKLFKPFQQIDKNKPIGSMATGIGLSLTKELILLHKGFITVNSEVGMGSIFAVYLPVYESSPKIVEHKTDEIPSEGNNQPKQKQTEETVSKSMVKPLILVVEDNADMRTFLKEELQAHYNVIEAQNGVEGLERAFERIPDLVISDIMMDKMDGVDLCVCLKTDERTSHIPVILLTARHSEDIKITGYETGADEYITKPFSKTILLSRIKNLIDQRRKLRVLFGKENNYDQSTIAFNKVDSTFLDKVNLAIEKHIDDPTFNPEMLASEMFLSKMQLYRKITALTNQTVYNYIRTIRLNKAANLLVKTDKQIAEISIMVGFNEPSSFTKSFQQKYNQTPSQYKKANSR